MIVEFGTTSVQLSSPSQFRSGSGIGGIVTSVTIKSRGGNKLYEGTSPMETYYTITTRKTIPRYSDWTRTYESDIMVPLGSIKKKEK